MASNMVLPVAGAGIAFIVLAILTGWLAAKPVHAAFFGLSVLVLGAYNLPLSVHYGIWLYPEDLFFALLALAWVSRLALFTTPRMVPGVWWTIGAIQFLLLVWGYRTFGSRAGVDYRGHFYLWIAVCYFCSVAWSDAMVKRVLDGWIVCACMLCLLSAFRWFGSALDPEYAARIMGLDSTGVRFRVVSASSALVIAVGFLILLHRALHGSLPVVQRLLLPVFLLTVVILQHRSVWASLLVGTLALLAVGQGKGVRAAVGIGLLALPLVAVLAIPGEGNSVVTSIKTAAGSAVSTKEGTMVARLETWQELLAKWRNAHNATTYLIGMPYGSEYYPMETEDGQEMVDMVPHNHFVQILYRGGLLAVLGTVALLYRLCSGAIRAARAGNRPLAPCFVAILGAFLAYFIPYWATYACGMLLGIAFSYLGLRTAPAPALPVAGARYQIRSR
jgi:hypothetical protein